MDKHLAEKFARIRRQSMERAAQFLMNRAETLREAVVNEEEYEKNLYNEVAAELREAAAQVRRLAEVP